MSSNKVVLTNSRNEPYVSIYYNDTLQASVDVWVGDFESKENFILGLSFVLECIKKNNARKWLADLSGIEGDFSFMKAHIIHHIIPEAKKFGLQYEALVLPHNIFGLLSVQTAMEEIEGIEIRLFATVEQAVAWLSLV